MNINLHIERLILAGLTVTEAQGPIIGAAVKTELARLLAAGELESSLQSGGAWPSLPSGGIHSWASKPTQLGEQIAQAVYREIGQERASASRTSEGRTHVRLVRQPDVKS